MAIINAPHNHDKLRTYAWSLCWMMCHGKTEEQAITSLRKRFSWLDNAVIDVAMGMARKWIKNAGRINAHWKREDMREQGK